MWLVTIFLLRHFLACKRVKTPTAAAEFLLQLGKQSVEKLNLLGREIALCASQYVAGCSQQLGMMEGRLPSMPGAALTRAQLRIDRIAAVVVAEVTTADVQTGVVRQHTDNGCVTLYGKPPWPA